MIEFHADLHCHTHCSDGTDSPTDLVKLAKTNGLSGLSITDHDSIEAYHEAIPVAKELGVEIISGVEFSAVQDGVSVHILAYSFALNNPLIQEFCKKHQKRREKRNKAILELLAKNQMPISEEELISLEVSQGQRTIGRPHIALAMIKKGYVKSINDAFRKFLGEDCPCYYPGDSFSVQETLDIIHKANGYAVIAHPHLLRNGKILQQLTSMPFDGIEVYYAYFPEDKCRRWIKMANKKGWFMTGGSDFHGTVKPRISLGSSWVPETTFRFLQERYKANI